MNIIVFALVVVLDADTGVERVASHWARLQHCLSDARLLSRREDNYRPIVAYCKPVEVDAAEVTVLGLEATDG